jgi:hypothetical protein
LGDLASFGFDFQPSFGQLLGLFTDRLFFRFGSFVPIDSLLVQSSNRSGQQRFAFDQLSRSMDQTPDSADPVPREGFDVASDRFQ